MAFLHARAYMAEWCYMLIENFQEERVLIELVKVFFPLEPHEETVRVILIVFITYTTCDRETGFINTHTHTQRFEMKNMRAHSPTDIATMPLIWY